MEKNNSMIEEGDIVRICLDNLRKEDEYYLPEWVTPKMEKFDGVEAEVVRVTRPTPHSYTYELDGVTNWKDMPYTWTREALIKLRYEPYLWTFRESPEDEYPKYIERTAEALAEKTGTTAANIRSLVYRFENGLIKRCRYGRVRFKEDYEDEGNN